MKRNKIATILLVSLLFSACGKEIRNGIEYSSKSVFNQELLDNSILKDYTEEEKLTKLKEIDNLSVPLDKVIEHNYKFLIYRNNENKIGFYLKTRGKHIGNTFYDVNTTYEIINPTYDLIEIRENGIPYVYDEFGNLLLAGEAYNSALWGYDDYDQRYIYINGRIFMYTKDHIAISVNEEDLYDLPFPGDNLSKKKISLKDQGLDDYSLMISDNNYYHYFYEKENISSIYIGEDYEVIGYIGTNLVLQRSVEVPFFEENFSYVEYVDVEYSSYSVLKKFINNIYFVDLHTGEFKEKDFNIKLYDTIYPLRNEDKEVEYYCVSYYDLSDDKSLKENYTYVVDEKFVMYDDISFLNFTSLVKLEEDYYYDEKENIIYDKKFNYVTSLLDVEANYYAKQRAFLCSNSSKYGVINHNGEVLIEFLYDSIKMDSSREGYYIAKKEGTYYQINTNNNEIKELENISVYDNNLLVRKIDNQKTYFTINNDFEYKVNNIEKCTLNSFEFSDYKIICIEDEVDSNITLKMLKGVL